MVKVPQFVESFDQQIQTLLDLWSGLSEIEETYQHVSLQDLQDNLHQRLLHKQNGRWSQDVYQVIVEHSLQGLALVQEFDIVYANPILSEITGYTLDEMRAFSSEIITAALYSQDPSKAWLRLVGYLADGILVPRLELCFPHKDGSNRWAEIYASSLVVQEQPTILITCVDTTERKQAELELQQLYARLELEVRERAEELATTNGTLQAEIIERKQAEKALQQAHSQLEIRVQQRTEELANVNQVLKNEIFERQKVEDALRRSEELFRSLSENASDIISVIGGDGVIRYESPSIKRLLGYEPEELSGRNVYDYIHTDDIERVQAIIQAAIAEPGLVRSVECRFRHKDGSWRILESIGKNLLGNSVVDGLVVNSRDITHRKKIEDEKVRLLKKVQTQHEQLQLLASRRRHLAQQVVTAQEEERYRVSRELHDEAGQALTALKVSLEIILSRLADSSTGTENERRVYADLQKALVLCESTSAQIRSLAHDLRPAALDDLGLDLALEGFCREFSERTNLSISYIGDEVLVLPDTMAICLYRILQEALTNVAKHAQAKQVQVVLTSNNNCVELSVHDDGQGFTLHPNQYLGKQKLGIGLIGMQERLESLGGQLQIESSPKLGTRLVAVLPRRARDE